MPRTICSTVNEELPVPEVKASPRASSASLSANRSISSTIHILGPGNVGKFVAHSLRGIPKPPPITLLLHRHSILAQWDKMGRTIRLSNKDVDDIRAGCQAELALLPSERIHSVESGNYGPIDNLIVTVKAYATVKALTRVAHRLTRDTTILFLQNGMGMLDEVNEQLFPDVETRPNYMVGIISHGLFGEKQFAVVHAGMGTIAMGALPRYPMSNRDLPIGKGRIQMAPSSLYILRTFTRTPILGAVGFATTELLQYQLEKLAINAIINPLTVLFDCDNGELLCNMHITRVARLLLSEVSLVLRSLPELQNVSNLQKRFSMERLEVQVFATAKNTAANRSSMLQDIHQGRQTEVEYINGYIVRRGEELGIMCAMNYMVMMMVKGKHMINSTRMLGQLPFTA